MATSWTKPTTVLRYETDEGEPVEPDSSRRWRIIAAVLAVLGVVLAIVLILVLTDDDDTNVSTTSNKNSTSTSSLTSTTSTTVPTSAPPPSTPATSSGGGGTSPTAPTTPATGGTTATTTPAGPVITSYTANPTDIACPAPDVSTTLPTPMVTLTWTTQNATGVDISVDGPGVYGSYGPNGNTQISVPCNGATHTYQLTAHGTGGQTASQTRSVATHT